MDISRHRDARRARVAFETGTRSLRRSISTLDSDAFDVVDSVILSYCVMCLEALRHCVVFSRTRQPQKRHLLESRVD